MLYIYSAFFFCLFYSFKIFSRRKKKGWGLNIFSFYPLPSNGPSPTYPLDIFYASKTTVIEKVSFSYLFIFFSFRIFYFLFTEKVVYGWRSLNLYFELRIMRIFFRFWTLSQYKQTDFIYTISLRREKRYSFTFILYSGHQGDF